MDVLVCLKRTPAVGSAVPLTADGLGIDTRTMGFTIGPHEECAVEEAVRIAERTGGSAGVLTVGPPEAEEQLRYAMSMGADHAVRVDAGTADPDPEQTAAAITTGLRELGGHPLVLFGATSADSGHHQVGARVARALRRPFVGWVKGLDVADDEVWARREVDDQVETYRAPLPAVLAVAEGLNLPRYPTIKGRLRARKAPIQLVAAHPGPGGLRTVRLRHPAGVATEAVVLGRGAAAAGAVVDVFEQLGVTR
ncbi:electron transfer flavoprotein subunit beta/FixA family protein [Actinomycetospora sp.]|jgi:electron transfer flavoprotein beta subunit|uniref:electron transfer flavoprotein subunit beta/FixA family protein n=1 Tax=Actinomycetospora sp. TaxID=1872135 RepID=UPI002F3F86D8